MGRERIHFFSEDTPFRIRQKAQLRHWVRETIAEEDRLTGDLNFIFCSDSYLLTINRQYLDHDTYTDIVTFDNSEEPGRVGGDIFISIDRVTENAKTLGIAGEDELARVMIHGVLHLIGYGDKSDADRVLMRAKEDRYILKKRTMLL